MNQHKVVREYPLIIKRGMFSSDGLFIACITEKSDGVIILRNLLQDQTNVSNSLTVLAPPKLTVSVSFNEPSGNNVLDALEKGIFVLTIKNEGRGPAKRVNIELDPMKIEGLNYSSAYIDQIPPGESKVVEIPIKASIDVETKQCTITMRCEEGNGFSPSPVAVTFGMEVYEKPNLVICDVGLENTAGNGRIESGKIVKLVIRVKNEGKGRAGSVLAKVYPGNDVFLTQSFPTLQNLKDILPGETKDVKVEFFVNDKTSNEIPLYIDFTEETSLANVSKLRIPITKSEVVQRIEHVIVKSKNYEYINEPEPSLSVDIEEHIPQTSKTNSNAIAVIIGIREYASSDIPRVEYAKRDAQLMREYLVKVLGYDPTNILPQNPDELMTVGNMKTLLRQKLPSYLKSDGTSDVFVYYAGHGAPDIASQQPSSSLTIATQTMSARITPTKCPISMPTLRN